MACQLRAANGDLKGPSRTRAVGREKRTLHRLRRSTGAFLGGMSNQSPGEPLPSSALPRSSSRCRTCGVGEGVMLPPDRWRRAVNRQRSEGLEWEREISRTRSEQKSSTVVEALSLYLSCRIPSATSKSTEGDFRPLPRLLFLCCLFYVDMYLFLASTASMPVTGRRSWGEWGGDCCGVPNLCFVEPATNRGAHYVL